MSRSLLVGLAARLLLASASLRARDDAKRAEARPLGEEAVRVADEALEPQDPGMATCLGWLASSRP